MKLIKKSKEAIEVDNIVDAYGRLQVKLAELECELLRNESKLMISQLRGFEPSRINWVIDRLKAKVTDVKISISATQDKLDELNHEAEERITAMPPLPGQLDLF